MDLTFQVPMQYCSLQHQTLLHHLSHPQLGVVFAVAPSLHSVWSFFSTDLQYHIGYLLSWGVHLSVSYLFAFSYCSWGSQGKNTEVVCHPLLQWTTFCQKNLKVWLSLKNIFWPGCLYLGFPGGSDDKESACNAGDPGLTPGLERSPGEGNGNPIQCSSLEIPWTEGPDGL